MEANWMKKNASYRFRKGPIALALSYKQRQKLVAVPQKSSEDVHKISVSSRKEEKKKQPKPEVPKKIKKSVQTQTPKPPKKVKPLPIATKPQPSEKEKKIQPKITPDTVFHSEEESISDHQGPEMEKEESDFSSDLTEESYQEAALPHKEATIPDPSLLSIREAIPIYRENPLPKYPKIARRRGYQGTVVLEVLVNEEGRVGEMRIFRSSGHSVLDQAAMSSVKHWVFEPGRRGNKKVEMWVKVPIRFQLR